MIRKSHIFFSVIVIANFWFLISCSGDLENENREANLVKSSSIVVTDNIDQPELIMEGLQVDDDSGMAYGIDFRKSLPFRLDLENGDFQFIGATGAGPDEFSQPLVIALKNSEEVMVYDIALDRLVFVEGNEITDEMDGYADHGVWIRNTYGFFWNGYFIHSLKEPDKINSLDFNDARPIGFFNVADGDLSLKGEFSSTLDDLDPLQKYPMIAFDKERELLYYVFRSDYTIMEFDLNSDATTVAGTYKPDDMRTRTIPFDHDNAYHFSVDFSKQLNEDRTQLVGIDLLSDRLVVVHHNIQGEFLEDRDPELANYFGVVYDLPDLTNPREFTLPGKFLGTWGDKLLIEENEDPLEYTIGFYEFE